MNRRDFIRCMGSGAATALVLPEVLAAQQQRAPALRLADVTAAAGLQFRHNSGAFGGKLLPETMGAGCAFLDYDADGWQDVLLVNGMDWPGHKRERSTLRLYRNNRNGTFTDVTRAAGLDIELYGMGVAVGDWNNDGFPDSARDLCRAEPAVPQHRQGNVCGRHQDERPRRPVGFQHVGALVRLRPRWSARSVRVQLRQVVGRARCLLQRRREAEVGTARLKPTAAIRAGYFATEATAPSRT